MKKLRSHLHSLVLLVAAAGLFLLAPRILHFLDPTAATFDSGYAERPVVGALYFFAVLAMTWLGWEMCFPTLAKYLDTPNWFDGQFQNLRPEHKIILIVVSLLALLAAAIKCVSLVPV